MKFFVFALSIFFLSGCDTTNMQHYGTDGSYTISKSSTFLMRTHTRIEKVSAESIDKVQFSPPYKVPETASNDSGFGGIFSALVSIVKGQKEAKRTEKTRSIATNQEEPRQEAFVYDHDSDSEPAVRTARIATVGAVTAYMFKP